MSTLLFTIFCLAGAWIVFNAVYSLIICQYFHTKLKYRLFALLDDLRNLRIANLSLDDNVLRMMEIRINMYIVLVQEVSFLRMIIVSNSDLFLNEKDKASALEMQRAIQWITANKETEIGRQLFDIEKQAMRTFQDSLACNSPLAVLLFYVVRPIARFQPRIVEWFKRKKESIMNETTLAMMVNAVRQTKVNRFDTKV